MKASVKMSRPFRIAVSVEHSRGWGRRVCEGFRTQQYFCLCFRREKGMAPGAYRERAVRGG